MHQLVSRRWPAALLAALLALGATALFLSANGGSGEAIATHKPADKVAASGSTEEVIGPNEEATLLSGTLRTSSPSDLLFQVTAECSIVTNVKTVGDDDQEAEGRVTVWVEVDGDPVQVDTGATNDRDAAEEDQAVFCNRKYRRKTSMFEDDENATIETFLRTRQAHGFNWIALDVGHGIHSVEVKATLEASQAEACPEPFPGPPPPEPGEEPEADTGAACSQAVVGNRTLIVEPTKMANDAGL